MRKSGFSAELAQFFFFSHLLRWLQSTLLWHNACVSKTHHAVQNLAKKTTMSMGKLRDVTPRTLSEIYTERWEHNENSNTILFVVHSWEIHKHYNKHSTLPWKRSKVCLWKWVSHKLMGNDQRWVTCPCSGEDGWLLTQDVNYSSW